MAQPTSNFKLIFISVFIVAAIGGILVFSGIINIGGSSGTTSVSGTAVLWGTIPESSLATYLDDFGIRNQQVHVTYVQKDPATYEQALVEAIASGNPPDLVLLPDNLIWRFRNKLTHIPFTSLPASTFQATFVDSANVFGMSDGYSAIPWAVDPLILYYNKDLLSSAGIAKPPTTWKEFVDTIPLLAKKENDLTITQSATALGTYKNIAHAKDILALLLLQSGNNFITTNPTTGELQVHFGTSAQFSDQQSASQVMGFYTGFADTQKLEYTWNAGQPLDRDAFLHSTLAYYFGRASELPILHTQNPNLNFGVALPPQSASKIPMTTGTVYGLAIPKIAKNQAVSYAAATLLSSVESETTMATKSAPILALLPVRRDVLTQKPASDPYLSLFYNVTLVMKSWLDPNPHVTDVALSTLIKDISSSVLDTDQSLSKAAGQILTDSDKI